MFRWKGTCTRTDTPSTLLITYSAIDWNFRSSGARTFWKKQVNRYWRRHDSFNLSRFRNSTPKYSWYHCEKEKQDPVKLKTPHWEFHCAHTVPYVKGQMPLKFYYAPVHTTLFLWCVPLVSPYALRLRSVKSGWQTKRRNHLWTRY